MKVTKGERINVTATGLVAFAAGGAGVPPAGTAGAPDVSIVTGNHAGLIGLVGGSGMAFFVGANYNDVAPATGELYLGINDVGVSDNSGQFSATVRVQQP